MAAVSIMSSMSVISSSLRDDSYAIDLVCHGQRFTLQMRKEDIDVQPGLLKTETRDDSKDLDMDLDMEFALSEKLSRLLLDKEESDINVLFLRAALPEIQLIMRARVHTGGQVLLPRNLLEFYNHGVHTINLVGKGNDLTASVVEGSTPWPRALRVSNSMTASRRYEAAGTLPSNWISGVPLIQASDLVIEWPAHILNTPANLSSTNTHTHQNFPIEVRHVETGTKYHLKIIEPTSASRIEVATHLKLRTWGPDLPIWTMSALAIRDKTNDVLALLMDPKPATQSLSVANLNFERTSTLDRETWGRQIEGTLANMAHIGVMFPDITSTDIEIVDGTRNILITNLYRARRVNDLGEGDEDEWSKERVISGVRKVLNELGVQGEDDAWASDDEDDESFVEGEEEEDDDEDSDMWDSEEDEDGDEDVTDEIMEDARKKPAPRYRF